MLETDKRKKKFIYGKTLKENRSDSSEKKKSGFTKIVTVGSKRNT